MEPDLRAFGDWVRKCLERCGLNPSQLAQEMGYHRSTVSRFLSGKRRPNREFLARSLFTLWRKEAFEHPAEVMEGMGKLGMDPEAVKQMVKEQILQERRTEGAKFLQYLEGWNQPFADPRAQGVRLPVTYVERQGLLGHLRTLLTEPDRGKTRKRLVLWGMGGAGKSVLARAVALDPEILRAYPNGVLWAELTDGAPDHWLREWCRHLEVSLRGNESVWELSEQVRQAIDQPWRRFLIVLDDVWSVEDAEPLLVDGPLSAVVLTMRERHLAQKLVVDDRIVEVGVMKQREAEALIQRRLGARWREDEKEQAGELIRLVDHLPLALELGAAVVKRRGWGYVLSRLREEEQAIDVLALSRAERREHSLRITLDLSYENLPADEREFFELLGMFAPGEVFTTWDVAFGSLLQATTWMYESGGSAYENALERLVELVDVSLVVEVEPERRYRLHPLVACYAREKLASRLDVSWLWKEYVQHALDILQLGTTNKPGMLPPSGRTALLDERWPQIEYAWHKAQELWRTKAMAKDEVDAGQQALRWARGFGLLGCQVLWRWQDWQGVVRWATEAQVLYKEGYLAAWKTEPEGEDWGQLLCWVFDGLLQQGETDAAAQVLERLRQVDFGPNSSAWELRLRIREARLGMKTKAPKKRKLRRLAGEIRGEADSLLVQSSPELAFHVLAEVSMLSGDIAAICGNAAEAERRWWEACRTIEHLIQRGDEYGFDEWTLERAVARIVRWRAEHGLWREAARAGRIWVALRLRLGEDIIQPLIDVATWGLQGGEGEVVEWALEDLKHVSDSLEEEARAYAESAHHTLQGLLLAHRGRGAEARSLLEKARAFYAAASTGGRLVKFLDQVIDSVKKGDQPPLPLPAKSAPYTIPSDGMDPTRTFDIWLEGFALR